MLIKKYHKILKISPWAYVFQRPFLWGLFLEWLILGGTYVRREICNWASLMVGRKFTIFALFYFVFEDNLQLQAPGGGGGSLHLEGQFNGGFFALLVWGAYIWRGSYMEGLIFRNFIVDQMEILQESVFNAQTSVCHCCKEPFVE